MTAVCNHIGRGRPDAATDVSRHVVSFLENVALENQLAAMTLPQEWAPPHWGQAAYPRPWRSRVPIDVWIRNTSQEAAFAVPGGRGWLYERRPAFTLNDVA